MSNIAQLRRNAMDRGQWAARIRKKSGDEVESILARGADLAEARKQLSKVEYKKLWKDDLRYGKSMVTSLIKIAGSERLKKVPHVELPPTWGTLYELSKLTDKQFATAIDAGKIHPGMERKDVAALRGKPKRTAQKRSQQVHVADIRTHIERAARQLDKEERDELIATLHQILDQIKFTMEENDAARTTD